MQASNPNQTASELQLLWARYPLLFTRQCLGLNLYPKQEELFLSSIKSNARLAVKSATGTGKTFCLACVILHQLLCEPVETIKIIATSPSAGQLERGLRAEVGKLLDGMIEPYKSFFTLMKEKIFITGKNDLRFCSFVTGSAENKESLAGVHANKVIILVDEASAIPQEIMDTLQGNLTTSGSSLVLISNPVRPNGPFYSLFKNEDLGHLYKRITLTAWDSPAIGEDWIKNVALEYGEDSDFYRMRVLGEFPRSASSQFISTDSVNQAVKNNVLTNEYRNYPLVLGVDIARFGDDATVFVLRQGPKVHEILEFKGLDNMEVVAKLIDYRNFKMPHRIFVDGGGLGSGVVDRCKELNIPIVDVVVASKSIDPKQYSNLRSQIWGSLRTWLNNNGDIPNDQDLIEQLTSMQYGYNNKMQIQLMTKKDMKKLGRPSPDKADALALTFADDVFQSSRYRAQARPVTRSNTLWT